ncbi:FABP family protein [Amycolatopsis sp. WAC 04182]|uniref:FABP family protein n=1 Tax=Amycolatopsis sp. WAC 04182 TaxID=2203198 RepID=UPI000F77089C|nr:FABP family protein [Amycolatopsis sp. WAC 04182]RSN59240.1 FABP family protein [Amycolatopsis sp. WAC 04182]
MTASGDEAIQAAEKRAENTRDRNLPQFDDMPIPGDTANLREGANLNDACLALLPLVGVWRGEGEVDYPTIEGPYRFGMQLTIAHDGRPFLTHEARAWLLDEDGKVIRPAARESGFWRPQADDTIELLLTHNTGIVELFYGKPRGKASVPAWELGTDAVVRTSSAKDVTASQRLYGIVNGELGYVEERAMMGQELQPHTSALLRRVVG